MKPISGIEALTILFVGLKLSGHIAWSWWWILSPLWVMALAAVVLAVLFRSTQRVESVGGEREGGAKL